MATATSSLIQLNSVPSVIITHLERNKDAADYQPIAYSSNTNDDNADALNVLQGGAVHSWDFYGEIESIQYLLGDRPNVISATFSQRELYDLTMKNCKAYPYTYDDWRGRTRPTWTAAADDIKNAANVDLPALNVNANWNVYGCKAMVIVTGQDIANKTSTGVFSSNSLQVVVNWRPHSSFAGATGVVNVYRLYNHLIYGKEFMRIESDKAQFQSQSLDEATARRLTDPPLGSLGVPGVDVMGGSLSVGGSLNVGGTLSPLRNRGVSAIGSRLA